MSLGDPMPKGLKLPFFASSSSAAAVRPTSPQVLDCCDVILVDLPEAQRRSVVTALPRLRRASDMLQLRSTLYTVIARVHGEPVAQQRLARFDRCVGAD